MLDKTPTLWDITGSELLGWFFIRETAIEDGTPGQSIGLGLPKGRVPNTVLWGHPALRIIGWVKRQRRALYQPGASEASPQETV